MQEKGNVSIHAQILAGNALKVIKMIVWLESKDISTVAIKLLSNVMKHTTKDLNNCNASFIVLSALMVVAIFAAGCAKKTAARSIQKI